MKHEQLIKAITDCVPNAQFVLTNIDFDNIQWLDDRPKPKWADIENALANPLPEPEPTVEQKLSAVGLNLQDLKTALGL